jgi:WD40 repeat protein
MSALPRLCTLVTALACTTGAASAQAVPGKVNAAEPLPDGAIVRIQAPRWRLKGNIAHLAHVAGSKSLLAAVSSAEGVVVWDAATGKRVRQFQPKTKERPSGYMLSPDADWLATHFEDAKTLRIDRVSTGQHVADIQLPEPLLAFRAFSADGTRLAACTANKEGKARIDVWDTASGKRVWHLPDQFGPVAFLPDGALLTGGPYRARVWDVKTGKERERLEGPARLFAVAEDGKALAVLGDRSVAVWDLAALEKRREFNVEVGERGAGHLVWSADATTLVHVGKEALTAWDAQAGKELCRTPTLAGATFVAPAADGKTLYAAASDAGFIFRWDVATGRDADGHLGPSRAVLAVGFLEGGTIATAELDLHIRFWESATGKPRADMPALKGFKFQNVFDAWLVPRLLCAPDGKSFGLFHESGQLQLRDARTGKQLLAVAADVVGAMAFSPDGKTLALGRRADRDPARTGQIDFWDIATGKTVQTMPAFLSDGYRMAYSADGKTLFVSSDALRAYDLATGKLTGRLNNTGSSAIVVAGDGIVCNQQTMLILDAATGRQRYARAVPFMGPKMAASPDGRLLATSEEDGRVRLTAIPAYKTLGEFQAHADFITCLAFSPDGKRLVTCSDDRSIVVWDVAAVLKKLERNAPTLLGAAAHERVWNDLGNDDPAVAHRAVWALAGQPATAVPLLRDRLARWTNPIKPGEVGALVKQLESKEFATRQRATVALEKLGGAAVADLQAALEKMPPLETRQRIEQVLKRLPLEGPAVPPGDSLRGARAVEVLERIATPQAREVLTALKTHWNLWTARHARAALERLARADANATPPPAKVGEKGDAGKKTEAAGDPLPAGAVARFGSPRLRHGGRIGNICVSSDGRWIGSASLDTTVRVWSMADGKFRWEEHPTARHPGNLTISHDGNLAAVSGYHGEIVVGDLRTGKEAFRLKREKMGSGEHLAFTPDGRFLASQDYSHFALWDLKDRKIVREFRMEVAVPKERDGPGGSHRTYGLSGDGRLVAVAGSGGSTVVAVFDTLTGNRVAQLESKLTSTRRVAIAQDGRRICLLSSGGLSGAELEVYELATGKLQAQLELHGQFWAMALSPDGRTVAIGGPSAHVQLWDTATGAVQGLPRTPGVDALAFSADGRVLVFGNEEGLVRAVEVQTGKEVFPEAPEGKALPVAFADQGRTLLIKAGDRMHFCELVPGATWQLKEKRSVPIDPSTVTASPDGALFTDRIWFRLCLWDTATGIERRHIELHNGFDSAALTSKLVAIMTSGRIALHDLESGKKLRSFTTLPQPSGWLFSADEKTLVVAARSNGPPLRIAFFDVATGKRQRLLELAVRPNYYYRPFPMALSPDGVTLAVASERDILLVDAVKGTVLHKLERDGLVAFSPDGKTLATGGYERSVRLHDVATGKKIAELTGHTGDIIGLRWSPDGRLLASGSSDMTVLLWDVGKK